MSKGPMIIVKHRNFQPFKSPINGEVITSARKMNEHMARHGVVHTGEYGENGGSKYFERKQEERKNLPFSKEEKKTRIDDIMKSIYTLKGKK